MIMKYTKTIISVLLVAALPVFSAPAAKPVDPVPSCAAATNAYVYIKALANAQSVQAKAEAMRYGIMSTYKSKHLLKASDIELVENMIIENVTQDELDKMLDFKAECKYDYPNGILCPKSIGMNKFYAMYDKALKKSGRKTAYGLFKKTDGEITLGPGYLPTPSLFLGANITNITDAISYMNEELYYAIDPLAKVIAHQIIIMKRNQLIDNGYSVVYKIVGKQRVYSEGAEVLLTYCNKLVDAFNAPYFLGLNARLEEVGIKERFKNENLLNARDAQELAKKVLYGDVSLGNEKIRWMLRMTIGVSDHNALIDRINNGDEAIRKATAQPLPRNVKR